MLQKKQFGMLQTKTVWHMLQKKQFGMFVFNSVAYVTEETVLVSYSIIYLFIEGGTLHTKHSWHITEETIWHVCI